MKKSLVEDFMFLCSVRIKVVSRVTFYGYFHKYLLVYIYVVFLMSNTFLAYVRV